MATRGKRRNYEESYLKLGITYLQAPICYMFDSAEYHLPCKPVIQLEKLSYFFQKVER